MEIQKAKSNNNNDLQVDSDIDITIYTDPLCCWSWAFQPQLEQLQSILGARANWQYRMGGLIPSWNNFYDEGNSVTRPLQMGPVWMHAGQMANMPIHHQLWLKDPPSSSYPSCIAVKCVQLQSETIAVTYLQLLRIACMTEGKNIASQSVLFAIGEKLSILNTIFDIERFKYDYLNDIGMEAFRIDLDLVRKYNVNRFPTLIIKARQKKPIMVPGYRLFMQVLHAIQTIVPDLVIPVS